MVKIMVFLKILSVWLVHTMDVMYLPITYITIHFSILDRNMEIRYLTKDGNFILYEYKGDERKKLYIYDIYKKKLRINIR